MAVIYYGEGTHDAGFVGFRVARTVGVADDYRQEYFSLREYSYATAHRLAYSLDRKWEAEAEEVKRQNKTCKRRRNSGPNIIAEGLRAYISIENRSRMGVKRTYFAPSSQSQATAMGILLSGFPLMATQKPTKRRWKNIVRSMI